MRLKRREKFVLITSLAFAAFSIIVFSIIIFIIYSQLNAFGDNLKIIYLVPLLSFLIFFSVALALFLVPRLISERLKPLRDLGEMIKEIRDNDSIVENRIKSGDELEELGLLVSETSKKIIEHHADLDNRMAQKNKEVSAKNLDLDKTTKATINILEDIEYEKEQIANLAKELEKFKLALDNASDHIIITDPEGIVLYGNAGGERITGYSLSEVVNQKAGKLWHKPMPKEYYEKLWKIIKTNKKTFEGELENKRKNGEIYTAEITISPVLNNQGEIEFFIGIERDITHEKMVDLAKTEFVSLASHQLRTPLSSINWYAEMLLAGDAGQLNEGQRSFVDEIYIGNQRMVELVNSLLNVSRLELGTFAVDPEPTDIIKTAQSILNELQPSIIKKKIKITPQFDKSLPIIQADPKLLRIIFQNLLSNAVKYTPEEGAISIKINQDTKNILIEVADTGYGIPKQEQPRIFEKLFRAENVRQKDTEGTGLGLYIVKSIITQSGGKIKFKSIENKGTTFYLEIPLSGMGKKEGNKKIE